MTRLRHTALPLILNVLLLAALAQAAPATLPSTGPTTAAATRVRPARLPSTTTASAPASRPADLRATLENALTCFRQGRYADAVTMYGKLCDSPADAIPAAMGLADAHLMTGKYQEAAKALDAVAARAADQPQWHAAKAEALAAVGQYEAALAAAAKARDLKPEWAPAVFLLGQLQETLGRKKEALETYKTVTAIIDRGEFHNDPRSLMAVGQILDRHAILVGEKASEQAQNILHNYLRKAVAKDKQYWPAHLAAAAFSMTKHRPDEAGKDIKAAEAINKNLPDVFAIKAALLLEQWRFEQATAECGKALNINPVHADALLVQAAAYLQWRKLDEVKAPIDKLLAVNPNHLEGLSLLAALHVRRNEPDKAKEVIARVDKINPRYAPLYEAIGQWLAAARQFPEAEENYRKAIELAPELAGPVAALGVMYMQTGQEDLARQTLDKAFALDDYRQDVVNYVNLLARMAKFKVKETPHFIIKVEPGPDEVLLDWLADVAERIQAEVCKDFDHTPPDKIIIEMFPDHATFSTRITGRGWIGTVGACTGRVIAMPAPDPLRGGMGTFNWAVVLRHEYTHAVTLSRTKNRIPHWFTEACAVWEQPDRRNFEAVRMLVEATRTNKLFPAKQLDWGFIRPQSGGARGLAYAQSEWIFEYVVETKGYDTIPKMLQAFADNWPQQRVFKDLLGASEEQFDKDFHAWAVKQVTAWGFDPEPTPVLAEAEKTVASQPSNAEALAAHALALYRAGRLPQAEAAARHALTKDPLNKRALTALAGTLLAKKDYDKALEAAADLEKADPKTAVTPRIQAEVALARQQWLEAITALEKLKQRQPLDDFSYEKLAKLYTQMSETDKAVPNLIARHRGTMRDPTYARQVADIYRAGATPEKAIEFYEQVIQINPYDGGAYKAISALYLRGVDNERAIHAMNSACLLEPKSAEAWTRLAMVQYRVGKATAKPVYYSDARAAAQKALELDPAGQATQVLQMIEQATKTPATAPEADTSAP